MGFDVESYQLVYLQALNMIIQKKKKHEAFSNIKIPQYFSQHKNKLLKEKIIQHLLGVTPLNCTSHISFWIYRPYGQKDPFATQGFFQEVFHQLQNFGLSKMLVFQVVLHNSQSSQLICAESGKAN